MCPESKWFGIRRLCALFRFEASFWRDCAFCVPKGNCLGDRKHDIVVTRASRCDRVWFEHSSHNPHFSGLEKFEGRVIHSADYVNAKPFSGQNVLVIGMGNTGAEIALDLSEGGAQPTISIRGGVHIVPRDLFGMPIQLIAMLATSVLPLKINDALFPPILDLALGDLSRHGIKRPGRGILEQVVKLGIIPVLELSVRRRKNSEGAIKVMPGISTITADTVIFEGGPKRRFNSIIFATGYRPSYQSFLEQQDLNLNGGRPSNYSTGIYFVGFHSPVTGLLRQISKEAVQIAADIVRQRNQSTPQLLRVAEEPLAG